VGPALARVIPQKHRVRSICFDAKAIAEAVLAAT